MEKFMGEEVGYRDSLHLKLYVKTKITKSTDLENINGQTGRLA